MLSFQLLPVAFIPIYWLNRDHRTESCAIVDDKRLARYYYQYHWLYFCFIRSDKRYKYRHQVRCWNCTWNAIHHPNIYHWGNGSVTLATADIIWIMRHFFLAYSTVLHRGGRFYIKDGGGKGFKVQAWFMFRTSISLILIGVKDRIALSSPEYYVHTKKIVEHHQCK